MDRNKLYKKHVHNAISIKNRLKSRSLASRKAKREQLLSNKRHKYESKDGSLPEGEYEISEEQVIDATKQLVQKAGEVLEILQLLRNGFTQGSAMIDAFLTVEGAMVALVGHLSGPVPENQLEAAWCITNMAANTDEQARHALNQAGPYLITHLSSSNVLLQDQCAWALGNMAGIDQECRDKLYSQGILEPLIDLLKVSTENTNVVRSAAFALSNLAREDPNNPKQLVGHGVLPLLLQNIQFVSDDDEKKRSLAEVLWVTTYISAVGDFEEDLVKSGLLERCVAILHEITQDDLSHFQLITPLMRTIGNIVACSHSVETITHACSNSDFLPCLVYCLHSGFPHINKEALWVLSNLTTCQEVCDELITKDLLAVVCEQIHGPLENRIEAAYSLCNVAHFGPKYCERLLEAKVLRGVVDLLSVPDEEAIKLGLSLVDLMLGQLTSELYEAGKRHFEEAKGMEAMERLEYHNNTELQAMASGLLEKYFYQEEEPGQETPGDDPPELQADGVNTEGPDDA